MGKEVFDINNVQIQMTMVIKLQQLQREELSTLTYTNLEQYMSEWAWKKGMPTTLHDAVNDIMSVHARDIVQYLSRKAMTTTGKGKINELAELIGGKEN